MPCCRFAVDPRKIFYNIYKYTSKQHFYSIKNIVLSFNKQKSTNCWVFFWEKYNGSLTVYPQTPIPAKIHIKFTARQKVTTLCGTWSPRAIQKYTKIILQKYKTSSQSAVVIIFQRFLAVFLPYVVVIIIAIIITTVSGALWKVGGERQTASYLLHKKRKQIETESKIEPNTIITRDITPYMASVQNTL